MNSIAAPFNLKNPFHILAVGFGTGLLKPAPGTWGSVMGAVLVYVTNTVVPTQTLEFAMIALAVSVLGVPICGRTAHDIGVHDHGSIVWDEIAGMFVVMAFVPFSLLSLVLGFVLFRILDIAKPWPIKWFDQRVEGGLGIMLDDIVAGLLAGLVLLAAILLLDL